MIRKIYYRKYFIVNIIEKFAYKKKYNILYLSNWHVIAYGVCTLKHCMQLVSVTFYIICTYNVQYIFIKIIF